MQHFDAIVIGGSYAGLSAAMQLARARRAVCIVDAGQPRNRFAHASHGFFGQDGARPAEMIARAREQVLGYPTVTLIEGEAISARRGANGAFTVELNNHGGIEAARLVLAHGVRDTFPAISGLEERWGVGILHCPYCHGFEVAGGRLGVLHVAPGSLHHALLIPDWGPTTYFLNGQPMPDEATLAKLRARGVTIEPELVEALEGSAPELTGARLADGRVVPLDALFIAPSPCLPDLAAQLGCELEDGPNWQRIRVDEFGQTSVPGVYAAGDAVIPFGNATLASAGGVTAGAAAHQSLIFAALE